MDTIPVVDLAPLRQAATSNNSQDLLSSFDHRSDDALRLAKELTDAFKHIGFAYLINHGIEQDLIDRVHSCTSAFFNLPIDTKAKFRRNEQNHGWIGLQVESLDPRRPADYKEAYNITPCNAEAWPNDEVDGFEETLLDLFEKERQISQLVLRLMGLGLGLEDPDYFANCHNTMKQPSYTTLRCLHYPSIPPNIDLAPGTVRCGEHSDYGSITILWQDSCGGLEVKNRQGDFIAAVPMEGSLVVNVGDLMQRWTSDALVSTRHRVLLQRGEMESHSRRSIAFFMQPDDDIIVKCIDGSDKYPPITAIDYIKERLAKTY